VEIATDFDRLLTLFHFDRHTCTGMAIAFMRAADCFIYSLHLKPVFFRFFHSTFYLRPCDFSQLTFEFQQ